MSLYFVANGELLAFPLTRIRRVNIGHHHHHTGKADPSGRAVRYSTIIFCTVTYFILFHINFYPRVCRRPFSTDLCGAHEYAFRDLPPREYDIRPR